jgi:hypothetical protein
VPVVGRRWCDGVVLASVRSNSMPRPRRRCTLTWGRDAAWSVPSESS